MRVFVYKKKKKKIITFLIIKLLKKSLLGDGILNFPNKFLKLNKNKIFIAKPYYLNFFNKFKVFFEKPSETFFEEIYLKGKGFKLFKYNNYIAFDLGYSNLFLFKNSNKKLKIHATKQKIIVQSYNKNLVKKLIFYFNNFYKIDKYHGKGIFFSKKKIISYKKLA